MMKKVFFLVLLSFFRMFATADEGMWIPLFLGYNEAEMQQMGFRLTADDIYSVNHYSMKDGIMLFGTGCTGELISPDGLLITNHHCGYSMVQAHSSVEHNYLHNGFWAKTREEEMATPGLTVTFLIRMEDVTSQVLNGETSSITEEKRAELIQKNIKEITVSATEGTHYQAIIKPFFYGNQYFMFVNEIFRDVRLVGVPPESIGKFGGDTDNWMWPRHTGDFSLWRIYTDKNGNPADYSPDNVPLKSKTYFPISIKGVNENDFTLVFGYPGTTQQFLISEAVDVIVNVQNPIAIHARDLRLTAMKRQMEKSTANRLMYAAKANSISNGWKKWQGESKGITECNVIETKKTEEIAFQKWVDTDPNRQKLYGFLLPEMKNLYQDYRNKVKINTYIGEAFFGVEFLRFLYQHVTPVITTAENPVISDEKFDELRQKLVTNATNFYKNYNTDIDEECFVELLHFYFTTMDTELIPESLRRYINLPRSEWQKMFVRAQQKTPYFTDNKNFTNFIQTAKRKDFAKIKTHELFQLLLPIAAQYATNYDQMQELRSKFDVYYRTYVAALMEKDKDQHFYPDANLTMRVTYGQVRGFEPADGVEYVHYTTLDGVIAKDNPEIFDYKVDKKLKELHETKDYGRYANANGELPVCFIASNHTTGGNSGSPVINANGELIGVNFDRVWEGTMSDLQYDVNRCRNISLDARYFLFIIDKFANAQNIIQELDIRQ